MVQKALKTPWVLRIQIRENEEQGIGNLIKKHLDTSHAPIRREKKDQTLEKKLKKDDLVSMLVGLDRFPGRQSIYEILVRLIDCNMITTDFYGIKTDEHIYRLSVILHIIGIPDDDPFVVYLKKDSRFVYPPETISLKPGLADRITSEHASLRDKKLQELYQQYLPRVLTIPHC